MSKKEKEIKVMEDHGFWVFTEDQIHKIKMHNRLAINKFFEDNYELIKKMAYKFKRNQINIYQDYSFDIQELINQVYVDLPYYNFESRANLFNSITKGSFLCVNDGGYLFRAKFLKQSKILRYDATFEDTKNTSHFLDLLATTQTLEETYFESLEDRETKDKKIIEFLEKTMKDKKQLNIMFCQLFTNIPLNEIKGNEYENYKSKELICESSNN